MTREEVRQRVVRDCEAFQGGLDLKTPKQIEEMETAIDLSLSPAVIADIKRWPKLAWWNSEATWRQYHRLGITEPSFKIMGMVASPGLSPSPGRDRGSDLIRHLMRKRYIKPSTFENETLGEDGADPLYTLLFIGLWCLADREGRLKDRPSKIKLKVFPYRTIGDMDGLLQWLADRGFIQRYEVRGERYIQVVQFGTHQSPHPNEAASVIPVFTADAETVTNGYRADVIGSALQRSNSNSNSDLVRGDKSPAAVAAADTAPRKGTAQSDPVERRIWTDGVELLTRSGMKHNAARSYLGRLAKEYGTADDPALGRRRLAEAIAIAQATNAADPKAYIVSVLQERAKIRDRERSSVGQWDGVERAVELVSCTLCGSDVCLGGKSCEDRAASAALKAAGPS